LWFDELATYYIADLPDLATLFEALRSSADAQPPLVFLLTRASHSLFGGGELATRLPSILAFGLLSWVLYAFVKRRMGPAHGIAAILFAWLSWAYEYAYEARPYSLVMALAGLSLLLWSLAAGKDSRRGLLLTALAVTLVALLSSHYYAGLLLAPLGIGECVRAFRRKRIDWSLSAILCFSPVTLLAYLPFLRAIAGSYQKGFFSPPYWFDTYGFYLILLLPAFVPVALALGVGGFVAWRWEPRSPCAAKYPASALPVHERAAAWVLAVTPILYVVMALTVTKAFVYRYALGGLFGVCVVFVDLIWLWLGPRRLAIRSLCGVLLASFAVLRLAPAISQFVDPAARQELRTELAAIENLAAQSDRPVAVSPPHAFFEYAHYASPTLKKRLVYLADPEFALQSTGTDSGEWALMNVARWAGLHVEDYRGFRASDKGFYLAQQKRHRFDWIAPKLESEGVGLEVLRDTPTRRLLLCCAGPAERQAVADRSERGGG
jgi:hypothetical protein